MKNKKTAYIMVPIVLAIWGMIGWKVYAAMKGNDEKLSSVILEEKVKTTGAEIPDTISLIANYRDPFLGKMFVEKKDSRTKTQDLKSTARKAPVTPVIAPSWPIVSYHGLIKRTGDQKTVGFLNVNGKSYFVQGGEEAGEVKVGKMWKDSVEILFGKDKKIFKK